jgi:hypothetical protein
MIDRPVAQEMARGEAGVASANDDRRYALDGSRPSGDLDGDVRGVRESVKHSGALLGLSDQRFDVLLHSLYRYSLINIAGDYPGPRGEAS